MSDITDVVPSCIVGICGSKLVMTKSYLPGLLVLASCSTTGRFGYELDTYGWFMSGVNDPKNGSSIRDEV